MPQWVAFDEQGKLLVNTNHQARAHIAAMQAYLGNPAHSHQPAPYMVAMQIPAIRYGIMGQLVNQGRRWRATRQTQMIRAIQRRVTESVDLTAG